MEVIAAHKVDKNALRSHAQAEFLTKRLLRAAAPSVDKMINKSEPYAIVNHVHENWAKMTRLKINEPDDEKKYIGYVNENITLLRYAHISSNDLELEIRSWIKKLKNPEKADNIQDCAQRFKKLATIVIPLFDQEQIKHMNAVAKELQSSPTKQGENQTKQLTKHIIYFKRLLKDLKNNQNYYKTTIEGELVKLSILSGIV
jgi:hypothetical protein